MGYPLSVPQKPVDGAPDGGGSPVEDMRVDHRRGDVAVAEQLLDCADVVAVFKEMRGKRVTEGVTARVLGDPGRADSATHRALPRPPPPPSRPDGACHERRCSA